MHSALLHENDVHGEDAYFRGKRLFAVLDGVSSSDGKLATLTVLKYLRKSKRTPRDIKNSLALAHEELRGKNALTTIAGALREQDSWWVFGVGDSPIYTFDHERVLPLDHDTNDPALLIRMIGAHEFFLHEKIIPLQPLMLMTDGVSDNIGAQELPKNGSIMRTRNSVRTLLEQKKQQNDGRAYDTFKEDDRTFLVVQP